MNIFSTSALALAAASGTAFAQPAQFEYIGTSDVGLRAVAPIGPGGGGGWVSVGGGNTRPPNVQSRLQVIRHTPTGQLVWERLWRVDTPPDAPLEDIIGTDAAAGDEALFVAAHTTFNPSPPTYDLGNCLIRFNSDGTLGWAWNYFGPGYLTETGPRGDAHERRRSHAGRHGPASRRRAGQSRASGPHRSRLGHP
ncbi:MAG: hypothetical protein SFY69_05315 [Planctomycetota bacterium]|nr:hypothetical protein [Planctomycetota bacterium]